MLNVLVISLILSFVVVESNRNSSECPNVKSDLSLLRKRRHVTFPDGSDVVLTLSLVKAFLTHAPAGWNLAIEIDVLFPLPDANYTLAHLRRKLHHRQKRELWERLRTALEFHNLDGRSCILKSICDAKEHLLPPGVSLVHDLLRAVFTAPQHDEDFLQEMSPNYKELPDPDFCDQLTNCPFSLLSFLTALNVA
ncbi:uncharacterized protein LOC126370747 [Pectinophora gossypiella]|uniref:uncharacterized protein LOC126370747 n=1 Tax=Pectinophora gossypiella TaxID=13191 RepID=UPI00214EF1ED|nr:uncharacterized protein LOC126370747 [Pectinophora gossypiella]